jgi:hypothetical protein
MPKLFLGASVLAFGSFMSVNLTHAALRAGNTGVTSMTAGAPQQRFAAPRPGDTVTLNPQPLPPKIHGRMLRR